MKRLLVPSALVLAACLLIGGCVGLAEYYARATEKPDESTPAPIATLATKVPTVVGNPGDFGAWIEIAKAVGYIVLGASAKPAANKAVKTFRKSVGTAV